MGAHKLGLMVLETGNKELMKVTDISVYSDVMERTCPELLITPPGFSYSTRISEEELISGFSLTLTSCDIGLQKDGCDARFDEMPDGVYTLKYSVSPNESVFVEYNHLRITHALSLINEQLCNIDLTSCIDSKEKKAMLCELFGIKGYFEAAKASVEIEHKVDKGMLIYEQGLELLDNLECKICG